MAVFKLQIELGNAAFDDEGSGNRDIEIARILRDIANRIEEDGADIGGTCYDINGNQVGYYDIRTR